VRIYCISSYNAQDFTSHSTQNRPFRSVQPVLFVANARKRAWFGCLTQWSRTNEVALVEYTVQCTTSSRKHRLVVEVESLASSSKKNIKCRRIFNKNYCDLLTAITHTKILVVYFIISDKKNSSISGALRQQGLSLLIISLESYFYVLGDHL